MAPLPSFSTITAWLVASSVNIFIRTCDAASSSSIESLAKRNDGKWADIPTHLVLNPDVAEPIVGSYIAVYKSTTPESAINAHQARVARTVARRNLERRQLVLKARSEIGESGGDTSLDSLTKKLPAFATKDANVENVKVNTFRAITLEHVDVDLATEIHNADEIAYLEQSSVMHIARTNEIATQGGAEMGLSRISHAYAAESTSYVYDNSAGYGITAYILDTGIQLNHTDFQGRAIWGTNALTNDTLIGDDNGHGTHVAGILGGRIYGVAKNIQLVAVRAANKNGDTTTTECFRAFDWIAANATGRGIAGRAVVNIALTGGRTQALNDAVTGFVNAGIVFVAPSGNDNVSTSGISPASAPEAITVGAIDASNDQRCSWSNYGPEVTLYAPGLNVLSTYIGSSTMSLARFSGTSTSVPHVAGIAAYLMKYEDLWDPRDVKRRLIELASQTGAKVVGNLPNTTSLIVNNGNL